MSRPLALDDDRVIHALVFSGVPPPVRDLFNRVSSLEGGLPLLRLLHANANSLKTIDDIAYHLATLQPRLVNTLAALIDLGLVRCLEIAGHIFYGVTVDPDGRQLVRELCDWQDRWHDRLAQIRHLVDGNPLPPRTLGRVGFDSAPLAPRDNGASHPVISAGHVDRTTHTL